MSERAIFWLLMSIIIGSIIFCGYLSAQDVKQCVATGRSYETCNATFNP